jgi:hypothetical protein
MKWPLIPLLASFMPVLPAGPLPGADGPRIVYSKAFPGSVPPYVQITLDQSGDTEYREAVDDDSPLTFKLAEAEVTEVYGLAEKLDYFKRPVESGLKVAFMGTKTFRYEKGGEKREVQFNYSEDASARALWEWFERMTESAQHRIDLDRAAKYDHLGLVKALNLLWSAIDRKRLVGLEQYLPTLDRIVKNETYMHTARARAAEIAESIRAGAAAPEPRQ